MADERAIIYGRQSLTRDEDDSLSLDFQERESRLLAVRNGWTILEPPILDPDVKGWDPLRPGIRELLARVERERADVVIVYAMSRFARDYILQESIWRQLRERGARLVSVHEPHAEDDLVRGILGVVSQAERRRMGAFLSSSFRERARRGLPHGKVPFGFQKRADGRLEPHPEHAPWALQIVERLEDGWSLWRCALWLNEHHVAGRRWEPNVVRNTVRTPAIAGGVKCADVVTWDAHEPIIDRERWERLATLLAGRKPQRRKQSGPHWLEGLMVCGCGAPMHLVTDRFNYDPPRRQFRCNAATQQTYQRRRYPACTSRPRSIILHAAESGAIDALRTDLDHLISWRDAYRAAVQSYAAIDGDAAADRKRHERELRRLADERDRLLVLYRRGSLDVERWETGEQELAGQIERAQAAIDALPAPPDPDRMRASGEQLRELRDVVAQIAPVAPEQLRRVLMAAGAKVQRTEGGVRILWPDDLALFVAR